MYSLNYENLLAHKIIKQYRYLMYYDVVKMILTTQIEVVAHVISNNKPYSILYYNHCIMS